MKWLNGLVAGAIAAILAALVSLPLDSPDDLVFNTGTVAIAALALGIGAGLLWEVLQSQRNGRQLYIVAAVVAFGAVIVLAAISETLLSGSIKFMLPVALLAFIVAVPIPPILAALDLPRRWQLAGAPISVVAALALGFGLAGMGDAESGQVSFIEGTATPQATAAAGQTPAATTSGTLTQADVAGKTFVVSSTDSELKYTVREKLANLPSESDAVGSTSSITGQVTLDGASQLSVDLSTLKSDQERRDGYIRDRVFNTDPVATFAVESIGELPASYTPGETITRTVSGQATIRGVTRPLTFDVQARYDGTTLQVIGTTDFTWADFDIPPPNVSGIVQVKDNVHIEILVVARAA